MRRPTITDHVRGEDHPAAKLTDDSVRSIRKMYEAGWSAAALARKHGVSALTIRFAVLRKTWKHVA